MILEVALPVPIPKTFDYLFDSATSHPPIGCRVAVLFGLRPMVGVVVAEKQNSDSPADKLKSIQKVLDEDPVLSEAQINLGRWLAHRYVCSLGEALHALLPPGKGHFAAD